MSPDLQNFPPGGPQQQYQQQLSNAGSSLSHQQNVGYAMKSSNINSKRKTMIFGKEFSLSPADYELFDAL